MVATELSTFEGTDDGEVITVAGHTVAGDGGGGPFYWSSGATTPEDLAMVFGNTSAGRWIRLWSGHVNVRWFGARGDGAHNDTPLIQAAIDFCEKQKNGGIVVFPPGVYIVSAPTDQTPYKLRLAPRVSMLGSGPTSELRSALGQNCSAATLAWRQTDTLEDVTIESILINGQERDQPHDICQNVERTAIFVYASERLRIINCVFRDTADAIRLRHRCTGTRIIGNEISSNEIDISRECIVMAGAYNSIVENNYIHDCRFATAIKMEGALPGVEYSNLIRGNLCRAVGAGVTAKGGCIVSDNIIEAVIEEGAIIGHQCHFSGNRIVSAVGMGLSLVSNNDVTQDVIVVHNTISNIRARQGEKSCDGIVGEFYVNPAGGFFEPQNITIANNIVDNRMTVDPTLNFNGIRLHSVGSRVLVEGNQIFAADKGITILAGVQHLTTQVCATNNLITVKEDGVGIFLSSEAPTDVLLRRAVVSGNVMEKAVTPSSNTTGIHIQGKPDRVVITANDASAMDQPVVSTGGPATNLVMANNNGF